VPRRFYALAALATVVAAAAVAAGLWLAFGRSGGHSPTRREYLARVSSVCKRYARRLERIGAPSDIVAYGDVATTVGQVLPLLRHQAAAMRAVEPPDELRLRLDRLFALSSRSIAELEATLAAANRRDAGGVGKGLIRFSVTRDETHALATAIGVRCETN
jgi:hypothetical protein